MIQIIVLATDERQAVQTATVINVPVEQYLAWTRLTGHPVETLDAVGNTFRGILS